MIFGFSHKNNEFQIQNEFKLINWVNLGVFSINRAVLYLFLAAIADGRHDGLDRAAACRRGRTGCRPRSRCCTR